MRCPETVESTEDVGKRYRNKLTHMLMELDAEGSGAYKHVGQLDEDAVHAVAAALDPGSQTH